MAVSSSKAATSAECLAVELGLEQFLDRTWDETDEAEGRLRYPKYCPTRSEANTIATQLKRLEVTAEVHINPCEPPGSAWVPVANIPALASRHGGWSRRNESSKTLRLRPSHRLQSNRTGDISLFGLRSWDGTVVRL